MKKTAGLLMAMVLALLVVAAASAQSQARLTQVVRPAEPPASWVSPASIGYGQALDGTQLNASSPMPGTFTYAPAAGAILPEGQQILSVVFRPTDTNYKETTLQVPITVRPAGNATFTLSSLYNGTGDITWRYGDSLDLLLTPSGDFHQPVALSCVSSAGYKCMASPDTMRPVNGALTLKVAIDRVRVSSAGLLMLVAVGWRRRRRVAAGMAVLVLMVGCGTGQTGTATVTAKSLKETKTLLIRIVDQR